MDELVGTKEVPVVAGTTVLDEQSFNRLYQMLRSSDQGDHKMAQLILNQVNIEKSIYWIWKLSRYSYQITNNMVNLRTKASRKFRDESCLFSLSNMAEATFLDFLRKQNWLTQEIYQLCLKQLHSDIVYRINGITGSKFYNFMMELKPEYKHLDPTDKLKLVAYD